VLSNIATMALNKKGVFEPYIKSFYINANDALHIKLLKLEILTSLASEHNVSVMIREFQVCLSYLCSILSVCFLVCLTFVRFYMCEG